MRDRTTIPTNQPLNNLKIMKTALLLTAGILLTGATAAVVVPAINGTAAPAQRVITELAKAALPPSNTLQLKPLTPSPTQLKSTALKQITVTFNDGMVVGYTTHLTRTTPRLLQLVRSTPTVHSSLKAPFQVGRPNSRLH